MGVRRNRLVISVDLRPVDPIPALKPVTKAELAAQLRQVQERGYVISRSERYAGAMGAAAPIFDASGGH